MVRHNSDYPYSWPFIQNNVTAAKCGGGGGGGGAGAGAGAGAGGADV